MAEAKKAGVAEAPRAFDWSAILLAIITWILKYLGLPIAGAAAAWYAFDVVNPERYTFNNPNTAEPLDPAWLQTIIAVAGAWLAGTLKDIDWYNAAKQIMAKLGLASSLSQEQSSDQYNRLQWLSQNMPAGWKPPVVPVPTPVPMNPVVQGHVTQTIPSPVHTPVVMTPTQ